MPRTKPSNPTYADYKRLARAPVSVTLPRWAVDYLYHVADSPDLPRELFLAIQKPRKAFTDETPETETVVVTASELDLAELAKAAGKAGRVRSAEALNEAIQKAKAAPVAQRKPRDEPKPKEPDDATETAREALRRMFDDGELTDFEIEAAKKRGLL